MLRLAAGGLDLAHDLERQRLVDVGDHDGRPDAGEAAREGRPKPGRAPGHDDGAAAESKQLLQQIHCLSYASSVSRGAAAPA